MSLPYINGIGTAIGSDTISPMEVAQKFGKPPRIIGRLGIDTLYRISKDETLPQIAEQAARKAMSKAGIQPEEVSGVYASLSSTFSMPGLSTVVGNQLGIRGSFQEISGGCAGGVHALQAAYNQSMVDSLKNRKRNYLVLAGDRVSAALDPNEWATAPLFSEGVSAVVVGPMNPRSLFFLEDVASSNVLGDSYCMHVPGPGCQRPGDSADFNDNKFKMNGPKVLDFVAYRVFPEMLEMLGLEKFPENGYFIPHQASYLMSESLMQRNNLKPDQVYLDGVKKGNLVGASVFFGLEDVVNRGLAKDKDIYITGFGANLAVASAKLSPCRNGGKK